MKTSSVAGAVIVAVAIVLLLAPSFGLGANNANAPLGQVEAVVPTPTQAVGVDLPPKTATPPAPTATPGPTATPQPPQVIYVQAPPQTIYVQAPAAPASQAAVDVPAAASPEAPRCHPSYVGVCLDASVTDYDCLGTLGDGPQYTPGPFRVIGPDDYLLDIDGNGIACDVPTPQPPSPQPTATPAPTQTPLPTATETPRPTRTPQPTATPVLVRGQVVVNFAGTPLQRPTASVSFAVGPGSSAWDAVRTSLGVSNLSYTDYGGDLGVFITGFYGAVAEGNHYWEFFVNGRASSVGVSGYVVGDGDILEFRYSSF